MGERNLGPMDNGQWTTTSEAGLSLFFVVHCPLSIVHLNRKTTHRLEIRMEFWIGAEVHQSVSRQFRLAANVVEEALNAKLKNRNYKIPVDSWDVIAIVLPGSVPGFSEVEKYQPEKRDLEFRLRLHYVLFEAAESDRKTVAGVSHDIAINRSSQQSPRVSRRHSKTSVRCCCGR